MAKKTDTAAVEQTVATPVSDENVTPVTDPVVDTPTEPITETPVETVAPVVDEPTTDPVTDVIPEDHESVQLDGQGGQMVGEHEVYSDGHLLATFHDGVAIVEKEVAKLLKKLGLTK